VKSQEFIPKGRKKEPKQPEDIALGLDQVEFY
jgi:hypothetical protein